MSRVSSSRPDRATDSGSGGAEGRVDSSLKEGGCYGTIETNLEEVSNELGVIDYLTSSLFR